MDNGFKSLKGQLLLDSGNLAGSFFMRTVVLVCEHTAEGALGLVLNRQSKNTVGEMILADLPEQVNEQELFVGGPVQEGALSYLHSDDFLPDANVLPNLSLSHSLEELAVLGDSYSKTHQIRVFAGYSTNGATRRRSTARWRRTKTSRQLCLRKPRGYVRPRAKARHGAM